MRKNWTAFKSLHKQNQIFRIVNLVVMGALCLTCVALAFYYGFVYDPNNRIVPAICIALLALVPLVIEMIFGRRFNNVVFPDPDSPITAVNSPSSIVKETSLNACT